MTVYFLSDENDKVRQCKDVKCASGIFWCW